MSSKKAAVLQIVVALFFAAAILATSALFTEEADLIRNLLIAAWFVPFSCLNAMTGRSCGRKCGSRNHLTVSHDPIE